MLKVVQINAIYGAKSTGTIVREIRDCCEKNGIKSLVVSPVYEGPNNNSYKIGNLFSEKLHALLSRITGKQAYYNRFSTWLLLRWLEGVKPDVVHMHNLHSNYIHLNMLLRYLAKHDIATIITMHDCWYFTGGCFHYTSLMCDRWQKECGDCPKRKDGPLFFRNDSSRQILKDRRKYLTAIPRLYLVGCSKWVAEETRQSVLKDCNIRYIYNGFDLDVFRPSPSDIARGLGIEGKHILLGPASKWLSAVNKETLDCFMKKMPTDYVLVLFGSNEHKKYISPNVLLYGYTSCREEMAQLYSMADVFVNCSCEDTLSSLNLEAQACGTPVVTYEATGNKETVGEGCGYAVETGDAIALFASTEKVLSQGKESYSTKCKEWVHDNFDKQKNYENYIRLYREIAE